MTDKEMQAYFASLDNKELIKDLYTRGMEFRDSPLGHSERVRWIEFCMEEIEKRITK